MKKHELTDKGPFKSFEECIHGGLKRGELGFFASRHGVGKTALLVQIGLYHIFRGNGVIHLSFTDTPEKVFAWYEDIFSKIKEKRGLEDAAVVHEEMLRERVIVSAPHKSGHPASELTSLANIITNGGFKASVLLIDGLALESISIEDYAKYKAFARKHGLAIWFSLTVNKLDDSRHLLDDMKGALEPYKDVFDAGIFLLPQGGIIRLVHLKDHGDNTVRETHLVIDPVSLLMAE